MHWSSQVSGAREVRRNLNPVELAGAAAEHLSVR
jgi:hypothetical protein